MDADGFEIGREGGRTLTGIDPDRLEEEKRRGSTIDLGFAFFKTPSGRRVDGQRH
jgi:selenocysteine-specific translation elongation factor